MNRPRKPLITKPKYNSCACGNRGAKRSSGGTFVCDRCAKIEASMYKDYCSLRHRSYLDKYIEVFSCGVRI